MKSEKGITLTSLVIYIIVLTIIMGIMATISKNFFFNVNKVKNQNKYAEEFNKFNMFFIQDIKNNKIADVNSNEITFEDGNTYIYDSAKKTVRRNEKVIAKNIQSLQFTPGTYVVNNLTKNLITVSMNIGKNNVFQKQIEYVLKYW